jgi:hypothetical protein
LFSTLHLIPKMMFRMSAAISLLFTLQNSSPKEQVSP